jgi:putative LysE/RhtB family amino acid efflux pump
VPILLLLAKSWLIGLAVAAPVGPIGVLCIRKTIALGFLGTLGVGLGAALADATYGLIAALGLTSLSSILLKSAVWIKLFGGSLLIYLGIKEIRTKSSEGASANVAASDFFKMLVQTYALTITNPLTILSFLGIFASLGGNQLDLSTTIWMVLGVFLGSISWFMILGKIVQIASGRLPERYLSKVSVASGIILICFGVIAVRSCL